MRFLLADDHVIVRRGLKQTLADVYAKADFGEAANANEALELVRKQDWDVLVLDVSMPGRSGLEVLREIKQARPGLPVIILSTHPEDQYAVRCLRAGAAGYLNKGIATDELVKAVRKVLSGGRYVSPQLAEKLAFELNASSDQPFHKILSDREYEVMIELALGKTVTEIANQLSLSVKTISTHRTHILEKMKLQSNADLTRYALNYGLIC
jgi:two-component system invasion response regulator UvrY